MSLQPDMRKVEAALRRYGRRLAEKPKPVHSLTPQDSGLRKPLRSHGTPCPGYNYHHFLHNQ